ncbi:hypothetical protein N658DRAFT_552072 [Parathielavia hyrcaniae]|uniref:Uncharacterized protein n=1 Tax=Parathielavia hyrcaniae TaxID=113614 RepID=A0AAN6PRP3_9PEZI|nr:hypothetical protein N658DRAFT_552072 [Parathielavia hyrcaniae]
MTSVILSQGTSLPGRTAVLCLLVGATTAYLWYRFPLAHFSNTLSPAKPTSHSTRSTRRGVHLGQVNPDKKEADTDIDIIAIHGLDTKSPDTWTWVDPSDPTIPAIGLVQKTIEEYAVLLLDGIQRELPVTNPTRRENRPVFFIASCLGGIVLAKALVDAGEEQLPFKRAIGGIVFLATPFRGTSFREVAALAEPFLTVWAWNRG